MEIIDNIPVWGAPVDDGALKRIKTCCYIFGHAAMMADHHIAGRDWVCDRVVKIMGARVLDSVHNHHNFAWRETHGGKDLWVVRKGATPAFPDQRGFVGGTMGERPSSWRVSRTSRLHYCFTRRSTGPGA